MIWRQSSNDFDGNRGQRPLMNDQWLYRARQQLTSTPSRRLGAGLDVCFGAFIALTEIQKSRVTVRSATTMRDELRKEISCPPLLPVRLQRSGVDRRAWLVLLR